MSFSILVGDCRALMAEMQAGSVHCCVTSPPYWGLRDYKLPPSIWGGDRSCDHDWQDASWRPRRWGKRDDDKPGEKQRTNAGSLGHRGSVKSQSVCIKCNAWLGCLGLEKTPEQYISNIVEVFREVRRVIRDDACVWLNLGDSYAGSWGAQSRADDHVDSLSSYQIKAHPRLTGTGSLSRTPGCKPKDMIGIPHATAFALRDDGWYLRSGVPWVKRAGMPDSAEDRPGSALEFVFFLSKSRRYYFDHEAVRRAPSGIMGGAAFGKVELDGPGSRRCDKEDRERYAAVGRQWRNTDLWFDSVDAPHGMTFVDGELVGIDVNPAGFKGAHFATFPPEFVRPLLKSSTSENGCCPACGAPWLRILDDDEDLDEQDGEYQGKHCNGDKQDSGRRLLLNVKRARESGADHNNPFPAPRTIGWRPGCECNAGEPVPSLVLDPFAGAATVGLVARRLGLNFIGCERNPEYAEMGRKRIVEDAPLFNMAGGASA